MLNVEQLETEIKELKETVKKLQHEYDTSRGLWCVDKNPNDTDLGWIRSNCFQLT